METKTPFQIIRIQLQIMADWTSRFKFGLHIVHAIAALDLHGKDSINSNRNIISIRVTLCTSFFGQSNDRIGLEKVDWTLHLAHNCNRYAIRSFGIECNGQGSE